MLDIKKIIEQVGVSLDELSTGTNIGVERLLAIAKGADFSIAELYEITKYLGIKPEQLIQKDETQHRAEMLFRGVAPTTKKRNPEPAILRLSSQISSASKLVGDAVRDTDWLSLFEVKNPTFEEAEIAALQFRHSFFNEDQVSPLASLPNICTRELRIFIYVVDERIDGASAIYGERCYIFIAKRTFKPRMLFTLAHEIGHLIAGHHQRGRDMASFDYRNDVDKLQNSYKKNEAFADAFASALLLPPKGVAIALKKIKEMGKTVGKPIGDVEILYLSRIFAVSFETAARRCEHLQLLPSGGALSLYEYLKKNFGGPENRARTLGLPPVVDISFPSVPFFLVQKALDQIDSGELSIGKAAEMLSLTIPDLYTYNAGRAISH